jgi:DNA-directed RNA polymerase subunit M/transcription elongation factor TFIIS
LLSPKEEKKGHVSTLDMINFACDCEAIIHSDKSKIGYAVKCANCGRIIVLRSRRIQRKS